MGVEGGDVDWIRILASEEDTLEPEHTVEDTVGMIQFDMGEVDVLVRRVAPISNHRLDGTVLVGVGKVKARLAHCFQFSGDSQGKYFSRKAAQISLEKHMGGPLGCSKHR